MTEIEIQDNLEPHERYILEEALHQYIDGIDDAMENDMEDGPDSIAPYATFIKQNCGETLPLAFANREYTRATLLASGIQSESRIDCESPEQIRTLLQAIEFSYFDHELVNEKDGDILTPEKFILRRIFKRAERELEEFDTDLYYDCSFK